MKARFYLLVFILLLVQHLEGQNRRLSLQAFGEDNGLSHREVNAFCQDAQGMIWIGTFRGLDRFDGYDFQHWSGKDHGFFGRQIYAMETDDLGRIWLVLGDTPYYFSEIKVFDPLTESFIELDTLAPELLKDLEPTGILKASDGALWIGSRDKGVYRYHSEQAISQFSSDDVQYRKPIAALPDGSVWVHQREGTLVRISPTGTQLALFAFDQFPESDRLRSEQFWVWGTDLYGAYRPNISPGQFWKISSSGVGEPFSLEGQNNWMANLRRNWLVLGAQEDQKVWFFDGNEGVGLYDHSRRSWVSSEETGTWLKRTGLHTVYLLKDGQCLLGGNFGFLLIGEHADPFRVFLEDATLGFPYGNNSVREMYAGCGEVYVNSYRGFFQVDVEQGTIEPIFPEDAPVGRNSPFYGLHLDEEEYFWLGSTSLFRIPPYPTEQVLEFQLEENDGKPVEVWDIEQDKTGTFWLGCRKGLYKWDQQKEVISRWEAGEKPEHQVLMKSHIFSLIPEDDFFWLCTESGLYKFDPKEEELVRYHEGGRGQNYLPTAVVYSIFKENPRSYWIGTAGNGLIHWDPLTGQADQTLQTDGLPSNYIYAIYSDCKSRLWLSTDNGVVCIDPEKDVLRSYLLDTERGAREFNRVAHFQDEDERIYFGGVDGLVVFQPCNFPEEEQEVDIPLVLTAALQHDKETGKMVNQIRGARCQEPIRFQPDDQYITLKFALLDFREVGAVRYGYQLDDEQQEWNMLSGNSLQLGRLSYGNHVLRIRGLSSDGRWSRQVLEVPIEMVPPFYFQSWFVLLMLVGGGGLILVGTQLRVQRLERQKQRLAEEVARQTQQIQLQADELKRLESMKSRFFANVSHDLRTPLTLILGPLDSLRKLLPSGQDGQELIGLIQENGKRLKMLINQLLDLTKLETGHLEVTTIPVNIPYFLRKIIDQYRPFCQSKGLELEVKTELADNLTVLVDPEKMEHILNNLLSNAMKFTSRGDRITVRSRKDGEVLHLEVADTGQGIQPEDLSKVFDRYYQANGHEGGSGIGLSFCRELATIMKGTLGVCSNPGVETVFQLRLPVEETISKRPDVSEQLENSLAAVRKEKQTARILVVEDNPSLLAYLKLILEAHFEIVTAQDGLEAWEVIQRSWVNGENSCIDLVLSDLMMPRWDGFQLLKEVRSSPQGKALPFLLLTARADQEDRLKALQIGVDDYLVKPFVESELLARLRNLLRLRKVREEAELETTSPENNRLGEVDAEWLHTFTALVENETENQRVSVSWLASEMNLSERQLQRKLKLLTGLAPNAFIREVRLRNARRLLERRSYSTVAEVAYAVGFGSPSYFSKLFFEQYGQYPSEYLK
jgi:signal transduction histidine kinase/DNA-binding response OmpR family regulator/ligand-binding sensor domain-containing protein